MQRTASAPRGLVLAGLLGALLVSAGPVARPGDVREQLDAIEKDLRTEFKLMRTAMQEADEESASAIAEEFARTILPEFLGRMADLARANEGTDDAAAAWMTVVRFSLSTSAPQPIAKDALAALTTHHIESQELGELCGALRYGMASIGEETTVATLETLGEKSPHSGVRANALLALGAVLGEDRPDGDPRLPRARELLRRVGDEYAAETSFDGRPCGEAARAFLFALDNLRVGQVCPDFEAIDAEGASFKLSDYRGKVVLIDFWGFW